MQNLILFTLLTVCYFPLGAQNSDTRIELRDSIFYINDIPIPEDANIAFFTAIFGEADRVAKRSHKNKANKTKNKYEDHIFDDYSIQLNYNVNESRVTAIEIHYRSTIKSHPKSKYYGMLVINGASVEQSDSPGYVE